jgi:hypothetical protein
MAETAETANTAETPDPSVAELRAMLYPKESKPEPEAKAAPEPTEPKSETAAPAANPAERSTQSEPAPEKKQEPAEEEEPPLPKSVQKRIEREVWKATENRRESDRIRKEAEDLLAKAKAVQGQSGSEPVKQTPSPVADGKPKEPEFGEKGHESEDWVQYRERVQVYNDARDQWLIRQAEAASEQKYQKREAERFIADRKTEAMKRHGEKFPDALQRVAGAIPEGMDQVIGQFKNWDGLVVKLDKEPGALEDIIELWKTSPVQAIGKLAILESSLSSPKTSAKSSAERPPLPEPLETVGGGATAEIEPDLEKMSFTQFKARIRKMA